MIFGTSMYCQLGKGNRFEALNIAPHPLESSAPFPLASFLRFPICEVLIISRFVWMLHGQFCRVNNGHYGEQYYCILLTSPLHVLQGMTNKG